MISLSNARRILPVGSALPRQGKSFLSNRGMAAAIRSLSGGVPPNALTVGSNVVPVIDLGVFLGKTKTEPVTANGWGDGVHTFYEVPSNEFWLWYQYHVDNVNITVDSVRVYTSDSDYSEIYSTRVAHGGNWEQVLDAAIPLDSGDKIKLKLDTDAGADVVNMTILVRRFFM